MSREHDLKSFSAVLCMRLQSKNTESFLIADMEVRKAYQREIDDGPPYFVDVSSLKSRGCLFLRYQHKLALGNEESSGWTKVMPESVHNRRPPCSGQYPLPFGPIAERCRAELNWPILE